MAKATWYPKVILYYAILYLTPYLYGLLVQSISHREWQFWKDRRFIGLMLFAVFIFTMRSSVHLIFRYTYEWHKWTEHFGWSYSVFYTISRSAVVFVLAGMYWWIFEKEDKNFYGFTLKNYNARPYFVMLLIMLPLIIFASTQGDFLRAYPRSKDFYSLNIHNPEHTVYYVIYELIYGLDFFSIEFFFRGFMVMAFLKVLGPRAIIPMALFYVAIHFGKPEGELISSFFGGTLLGIIAYYSRSIVGGIIVHIGIAWLMEIGGFVGRLYGS